jgi:hypothetical protein
MTEAFATASKTMIRPRSAATIAVDNFLRKALRVSDPRDPGQIANALLARYPEEAERDRRERAGLPYASIGEVVPPIAADSGATSVELAQAQDDLERDLQTLTTASPLKDIRVEIIGWGRAIRQVVAEGLAAARVALDPVNQDRALSARRALSEYARLGRYVGALSDPTSNLYFRSFARSCDVLAGMILVAVGEGLAAGGITRSTKMVRASASELQVRRDGVVSALRGLTGSIDYQLGQDDLPRGREAYRLLVGLLDRGGQSDLRPLLEETTLSQSMDTLIDLSTGASVEGLRELATSSELVVRRFQRLIQIGGSVLQAGSGVDSPPLTVFISSLQLFVDAFAGKDSSRLLFVARPTIIVSGIYGVGEAKGTTRLLKLIGARQALASKTERFGCECEPGSLRARVVADYLVGQADRAIDLYASGDTAVGAIQSDERAAAIGYLFNAVLEARDKTKAALLEKADVDEELKLISDTLQEAAPSNDDAKSRLVEDLRGLIASEARTEALVSSLALVSPKAVFELDKDDVIVGAGSYPSKSGESLISFLLRATLKVYLQARPKLPTPIFLPPTLPVSAARSVPKIVGALGDIDSTLEGIEEAIVAINGPSANVTALYAAAIEGDGTINTRHAPGDWLHRATGLNNLKELAEQAESGDSSASRQSFIEHMRERAGSYQGLPSVMTDAEVGQFFDLSPVVRDALGI